MSVPVHVVGIVATDPRLLTVGNGIKLCSFRLGSTQRRYDRKTQTWIDGETTWFTVNLFHGIAENAAASFQKGDRVIATGRLRVRQWEQDQRSGTSVEIEADAIGHDVRWGTSSFTKRQTGTNGTESQTPAETGSSVGWGVPVSADREQETEPAPF